MDWSVRPLRRAFGQLGLGVDPDQTIKTTPAHRTGSGAGSADSTRPKVGDPRNASGRSRFAVVQQVEGLGPELQPRAFRRARCT